MSGSDERDDTLTREEQDRIEEAHFRKVARTFTLYEQHASRRVERALRSFKALPRSHRILLPHFEEKISDLRNAVRTNAAFARAVAFNSSMFPGGQFTEEVEDDIGQETTIPSSDLRKHREHLLAEPALDSDEQQRASTTTQSQAPQGSETHSHSHSDAHQHAHSHDEHSHEHSDRTARRLKEEEEVTDFDMDKVYTTIKQFARDWSAEGRAERDQCYGPILRAIEARFATVPDKRAVTICIPGSGLGRLAFELASLGYCAQGNEWSAFMLMASNYVLNRCEGTHHTVLYPWAHMYCNNRSSQDQLRAVSIPDCDPFSLPEGSLFSMAAGDFLEIYPDPDCWDVVASCFFLDTARNVLAYLECIWNMLKPGGYLVNLGPLLYHFEDNRSAPSIELTYEELRGAIVAMGFVFEEEVFPVTTTYISDPASMLAMQYNCVFFVVRKPIAGVPQSEPGAPSE
eukprot:m.451952 g.451952  ORF g.451952 m.451952 type:complete len:458 (-) comp56923_c0_seq8:37-1410(-)